MDELAKKIINDAAKQRGSEFEIRDGAKIDVKGVQRPTRPLTRMIRVVVMDVPPCERYPAGAELYVMPRQVEAHKKLFPGARVLKEISKEVLVRPSGVAPRGAVDPAHFLGGKKVIR
jgi:hypothetical protein